MKSRVTIGVIGDYDGDKPSHVATNEALKHAAYALSISTDAVWQPTPSLLSDEGLASLAAADGVWCSPGSPYKNYEGALAGIRSTRECGAPFFAT
jgi:CTP synthase (UTP-ammonia lyase)